MGIDERGVSNVRAYATEASLTQVENIFKKKDILGLFLEDNYPDFFSRRGAKLPSRIRMYLLHDTINVIICSPKFSEPNPIAFVKLLRERQSIIDDFLNDYLQIIKEYPLFACDLVPGCIYQAKAFENDGTVSKNLSIKGPLVAFERTDFIVAGDCKVDLFYDETDIANEINDLCGFPQSNSLSFQKLSDPYKFVFKKLG